MLRCLMLLAVMAGMVSWSADMIDPISKRRVDAVLSIPPSDESLSWGLSSISEVDRESIIYAIEHLQGMLDGIRDSRCRFEVIRLFTKSNVLLSETTMTWLRLLAEDKTLEFSGNVTGLLTKQEIFREEIRSGAFEKARAELRRLDKEHFFRSNKNELLQDDVPPYIFVALTDMGSEVVNQHVADLLPRMKYKFAQGAYSFAKVRFLKAVTIPLTDDQLKVLEPFLKDPDQWVALMAQSVLDQQRALRKP